MLSCNNLGERAEGTESETGKLYWKTKQNLKNGHSNTARLGTFDFIPSLNED